MSRSRAVARLCCCALALTLAGCSLITTRPPPPERPASGPVECDEDSEWINWQGGIGSVLLGITVAAMIGGGVSIGAAAAPIGVGAALFTAALITQTDVRRCKDAKACMRGNAPSCTAIGWPTEPPKAPQRESGTPPSYE